MEVDLHSAASQTITVAFPPGRHGADSDWEKILWDAVQLYVNVSASTQSSRKDF